VVTGKDLWQMDSWTICAVPVWETGLDPLGPQDNKIRFAAGMRVSQPLSDGIYLWSEPFLLCTKQQRGTCNCYTDGRDSWRKSRTGAPGG